MRVKDRRLDRLDRWHTMLNYVNRGMLYDFRLCDLERFGACSSCQHGKHGAQCDEFGHQQPPSNSTRRGLPWGTNQQCAVTQVTPTRIAGNRLKALQQLRQLRHVGRDRQVSSRLKQLLLYHLLIRKIVAVAAFDALQNIAESRTSFANFVSAAQ